MDLTDLNNGHLSEIYYTTSTETKGDFQIPVIYFYCFHENSAHVSLSRFGPELTDEM